eukprot:CAMPEP_0179108336 /NCGR_PEP_ID=MMETSP0796-20121207/50459_1 /TAXON_ID=73915 /ORGANISM="Pyrodinium bahamense, Strain pbaha01" /LENGTH=86 /DNA_ID=CAMNT_0020806407 /DNA_START=41 /DNA_END=297 /DNA_ORIENTATION=+
MPSGGSSDGSSVESKEVVKFWLMGAEEASQGSDASSSSAGSLLDVIWESEHTAGGEESEPVAQYIRDLHEETEVPIRKLRDLDAQG